ncbi:prepilin-type N-terminal cleavage/methylation domain-containing protein [Desulfotruncus alcoholivorax]|uniref:prepilin-type N-terminal cleavage/methylation domain-containing protein n=1 Tax=Desulfotruncus alcoholivorax TaxID=265477 RepID=UPI0004080FBF|nr:prepilin-type N-terminal cleavage/methylation domain-containing protein [Desulfotruncus alcoholivorax]
MIKKQGFTLIELVITLMIMSIIAAIAMPDFKKACARHNLTVAAVVMRQEIWSWGQDSLQKEKAGYVIEFSKAKYQVKEGLAIKKSISMPSGVEITESKFGEGLVYDPLRFSARGYPIRNGHVTISNRSIGQVKYVIVAPYTGRVRVSDYLDGD